MSIVVLSRKIGFLLLFPVLLLSCSRPATPKQYGYFRIALPPQTYVNLPYAESQLNASAQKLPYVFSVSSSAVLMPADSAHPTWINIHYPSLNATIHCSYHPIQHNLPMLLADAQEFVYSHAVKASAIPEQEYADSLHRVFGVFYELQGNTATPVQFWVTDSTTSFFRAAVYINTIPNQDSLAPVIDYLTTDVRTMIESFRWQ